MGEATDYHSQQQFVSLKMFSFLKNDSIFTCDFNFCMIIYVCFAIPIQSYADQIKVEI